jgi:cytochrome c-type biogenesis protein CcmH/NrfG
MHFDTGQYTKCVHYARLAADRGGKDGRRWLLLGDAYFKVLRYADAIEAYERAESRGVTQAASRIAKVRAKTGR